jgi:TfoX/Sxy family transcriptional regulator of competence genes
MTYDEKLADRIRELLANERGVTEKKMFGGLAFLVHGNMAIAASGQGGALVRCNPEASDALVEKTEAETMVMARPRDVRLAAHSRPASAHETPAREMGRHRDGLRAHASCEVADQAAPAPQSGRGSLREAASEASADAVGPCGELASTPFPSTRGVAQEVVSDARSGDRRSGCARKESRRMGLAADGRKRLSASSIPGTRSTFAGSMRDARWALPAKKKCLQTHHYW